MARSAVKDGNLLVEGYTTLLGYSEQDELEIFLEIYEDGSKTPHRVPCMPVKGLDVSFKALDEVLFPAFPFVGKIDITDIKAARINLV